MKKWFSRAQDFESARIMYDQALATLRYLEWLNMYYGGT